MSLLVITVAATSLSSTIQCSARAKGCRRGWYARQARSEHQRDQLLILAFRITDARADSPRTSHFCPRTLSHWINFWLFGWESCCCAASPPPANGTCHLRTSLTTSIFLPQTSTSTNQLLFHTLPAGGRSFDLFRRHRPNDTTPWHPINSTVSTASISIAARAHHHRTSSLSQYPPQSRNALSDAVAVAVARSLAPRKYR